MFCRFVKVYIHHVDQNADGSVVGVLAFGVEYAEERLVHAHKTSHRNYYRKCSIKQRYQPGCVYMAGQSQEHEEMKNSMDKLSFGRSIDQCAGNV